MPSNKAELSKNAIRTKSCVNDLLSKSLHVSTTITYITVIAESPLILHSIFLLQLFANIQTLPKENKNKRDEIFEAAAPTGKEIDWERNKINISCCRNAFSLTHGCVFAFCSKCHSLNIEKGKHCGKIGKKSRRSKTGEGGRTRRTVTKVSTKTPAKTGLDYNNHTVTDLPGLVEQQDKSYLASKWKECKGYSNTVKHDLVVEMSFVDAIGLYRLTIVLIITPVAFFGFFHWVILLLAVYWSEFG